MNETKSSAGRDGVLVNNRDSEYFSMNFPVFVS